MSDRIVEAFDSLFSHMEDPPSWEQLSVAPLTSTPTVSLSSPRWAMVGGVLAVAAIGVVIALLSGGESLGPIEPPSGLCQEPPGEELDRRSPVLISLDPDPVLANTEVELTVSDQGLAEGANNGAGARWQCWDGSTWIDTHQLVRAWNQDPPEAIDLDAATDWTLPAVGLPLPNTYRILIPDVPVGLYRIVDETFSEGAAIAGFVIVEVVVEPEPEPDPNATTTSIPSTPASSTTAPEVYDNVSFDLGPLEPRGAHTVVWTGEEMIVWGGWRDELGPRRFDDGAAFDPATDAWRMIADSPLPPVGWHLAAWTGEEMIVVGGPEAAAYDPEADSWRTLAAPPFQVGGIEPLGFSTTGVWTGSEFVVWESATNQVASYSPTADTWVSLPPVPLDATLGALRLGDGMVYAFGIVARITPDAPGPVLEGAIFDGTDWIEIPSLDFSTEERASDARPDLVAWLGDRFIAWSLDGPGTPASTYTPGAEAWVTGSPTTVRACEGSPPPLEMGSRVFVTSCGHSIYDGETDTWTEVSIDGQGGGEYAVWTGEEILVWGDTCCYGSGGAPFTVSAWRYRPPD